MSNSDILLLKAKNEVNQRWWILAGLLGFLAVFNYPYALVNTWPLLTVFACSIIYNFILTLLIHKKIFKQAFSFIETSLDIVLIAVLIHVTGGVLKSFFFLFYPVLILLRAMKLNQLEIYVASAGSLLACLILISMTAESINWVLAIDRLMLLLAVALASSVFANVYGRQHSQTTTALKEAVEKLDQVSKENENLKRDVMNSEERLHDVTMAVMKKNLALMAFQEIYSTMSSTNNPRRLLNLVIDTAMSLMQGTAGCLMLYDENSERLKIKVARGMNTNLIRKIQPAMGEGIEGRVLQKGEELLFGDLSVTRQEPLLCQEGRSKLVVPLYLKNKVTGVLSIESDQPETYSKSDLELLVILGAQASEVLQNIAVYQEMRNKADGLELLFDVNKNIGTIFNLRKLFAAILERALQVMKAKRGSLLIHDQLTDELVARASIGLNESQMGELRVSVEKGIAGWVFKNVKPILLRSVESSHYYERDNDQQYAGKNLIACPLTIRKKVFGVICLNDRQGGKPFNKDDQALLGALASQAAIAIENAELYASIRRDYINAVKALAAAVDAKDHYTHGHSNKVMAYSTIIAKELGMNDKEIEKIRYGALLHDVGKIGIAESLLNKTSRLTPKEFDTIAMHPILGVSIVQNIESLRDLIPVILYHHERYNGGGYPEGKAGNGIPIGARIVAVADAWDVMTSDRAYRKALPVSIAVSELKKCSGTQFDPEIVTLFLAALKKNEKIEPIKEEVVSANLLWDEESVNWNMT